MTERPILFSGSMVRAILEGRKTQTRRVIKPQFGSLWGCGVRYGENVVSANVDIMTEYGTWKWLRCPYGQPDDLLWVREMAKLRAYGPGSCEFDLAYPADESVKAFCDTDHGPYKMTSYTPSIHMPRWASRLTLRITSVIVHKIQQIGDDEIMAEGIIAHDKGGEPRIGRIMYAAREGNHCEWELTGRAAFARLWDSINAKRGYSWESNPWVWAITFERVV